MKYRIHFTQGFIIQVDSLLDDVYDKNLKREDFFHLFYVIDRAYRYNEETGAAELPAQVRNRFGQAIFDGNRKWRFAEMVKICENKDILYSTSYSTDHGKCKTYGYTHSFSISIQDMNFDLGSCEISERTHKVITKYSPPPTCPNLLKHYDAISELDIDLSKIKTILKSLEGNPKRNRTVRDIITILKKDHIVVKKDDRTGRIYTSFNIIKKELREFCSYKGKPLMSLDLKSSQPYLLASILLQENPTNKEVRQFYNLITKEDLYDWMVDRWEGLKYSEDPRKEAKKMFFYYLYKSNRGTNSAQYLMMKYWPGVYKLIKDKKRYEPIWLTLQKLEADIFIPVCNKFVSRGCLSVHDSLYFVPDLKEEVEFALRESFQSFLLYDYNLKSYLKS